MINFAAHYDTVEDLEAAFNPCILCDNKYDPEEAYMLYQVYCPICKLIKIDYDMVYDNFGEYEKYKVSEIHISDLSKKYTISVGNYTELTIINKDVMVPMSKFEQIKNWCRSGKLDEKINSLAILI